MNWGDPQLSPSLSILSHGHPDLGCGDSHMTSWTPGPRTCHGIGTLGPRVNGGTGGRVVMGQRGTIHGYPLEMVL